VCVCVCVCACVCVCVCVCVGKYSLNGLRVKVYRQVSATQWFTGIITHNDQHSRTMIVMNDQGHTTTHTHTQQPTHTHTHHTHTHTHTHKQKRPPLCAPSGSHECENFQPPLKPHNEP